MPKQKFEVELEVPDGFEIVDYRPVRTDDTFLSLDMKAKVWDFVQESKDNAFILRKVPKYRDPVLPADWGKTARFSDDGEVWIDGPLTGYLHRPSYTDRRVWAGPSGSWYVHCQVLDE